MRCSVTAPKPLWAIHLVHKPPHKECLHKEHGGSSPGVQSAPSLPQPAHRQSCAWWSSPARGGQSLQWNLFPCGFNQDHVGFNVSCMET